MTVADTLTKKTALVILSGGQDSTTCLYWAKSRFQKVLALSFAYGQRHIIELESAKQICHKANIKHEIVDLGAVFQHVSSLTNTNLEIPLANAEHAETLPSTFVPGRNILFLSLAASRAYVLNCDSIIIGVSQEDYAGYPDCREDFIDSMEKSITRGLDRPIKIEAPLLHLTKKDTVELAVQMPGCLEALALSTTCYNGSLPPCQNCNACELRARGFRQAAVDDPLIARTAMLTEVVHARD
ncbi:MAG: 7-cyano-7-deazaguanine synthase QueC [Candidatus Obscuribacterales bacterium]|nr:7-cyano-7-deazaguanine synthase QueC [Candidatus Obscuribacterales bacterium]